MKNVLALCTGNSARSILGEVLFNRRAAGEACPTLPGRAMRAHWGLDDPAAVTGTQAQIDSPFARTWDLLRMRVEAFRALPFETMSDADLELALSAIGTIEGSA